MNLPKLFEEKMQTLLGADYEKYIQCFEEERHYGLRVNTNKISVEDFLKIAPWHLEPIPWIHNGFYYDGEVVQPAKHPYYFAGLYYLQEPSAMTPADRLPICPGDKVLDVCAAPGGKATELGARLKGEGLLAANDISSSRAKGLLKNLELFGIGNLLILNEEPGNLTKIFAEYFDKILIDAPCSGEGMFRKDKKMIKAWEEHGPSYFSKIQKNIIMQAASMLRPGGMMLYSTCTFDRSENEQVIACLLEQCPEFELCEIDGYDGFSPGIPKGAEEENLNLNKTVRIFPHRMKGEGHFLALLKKKERGFEDDKSQKGHALSGKLPEELEEFLQLVKRSFDRSRFEINNGKVYYMPTGLPKMQKLRFLRTGLFLGEVKKKRFEPSQAFAMNLKKEEYPFVLNFPCTDERVIKYLKGETLDVSDLVQENDKGWYLVCVDGYSLGFGKLLSGMLKNKYLPGWRWQSSR
ncbi:MULTISPECIES: RsmF rRNA methyltransferase first C-terminal domain-containing protein [Lachnospiraceae]|uniref:RsmF rRNA methyltransferase first C-terminal domain-containing protein n=1 Tax=Faecalicatena acetigenes TaxID=2981790 RepID=A0ABT2T8V6_9FIRM|nr:MULTISPECIES: RsmF rRNA methyltransferase first C-terminal domain-containing protein [Lachnospiraceae]MCU6746656.1 RsmF rRNA methyltransferase first C-terminal domain-containing protein [Faecalicatena acetigenes]RGT74491.1 SAM-dependent methyltransferase [Ruminococcus sp. AF18-22]SCH34604.1 Ribosomal RNA small subunit methyltransferase F [uncultured Clostridium sp.]